MTSCASRRRGHIAGMRIVLVPTRDSHNSEPTEALSGFSFTSALGTTGATHLYITLPDGREVTFDAADIARMCRALGVS